MDQKISHEKRLNDDASARSSKAWAAHVKAQEARIAKHREEHEVALEQIAQTFSKKRKSVEEEFRKKMKSLESELIDAGVGKFNGDIKKDEKVVHDNVKDVVKDIVVKNVGKKRALHCSWAFCVSLFVLLFIIAFGTIGSIRAALDHLRRDHEEFAVKSSSRENASFAAELSASSRMQLQAFVNRIAEGAVNEALLESFRNYSKMNGPH